MYCYHEFKLRYQKKTKNCFQLEEKNYLSLQFWKKEREREKKNKKKKKKKKKKRGGFLLFLKAFSWETDLWVTLGDFTVKNAKSGREICI